MKVAPLRRYRSPSYPTHEVLDEHPELLRLLPRRWEYRPLVAAVVVMTGVLLYSCRRPAPGVRVAPIFTHGAGGFRASYGCVAVTPPVFLTEDEAYQVIASEATAAGLALTRKPLPLTDVRVPVVRDRGLVALRTNHQQMILDMQDAKREIYVEYVSEADFWEWTGCTLPLQMPNLLFYSTAGGSSNCSMRQAAGRLRTELRRTKHPGTYAVFYDPAMPDTFGDYHGITADTGGPMAPVELFSRALHCAVQQTVQHDGYILTHPGTRLEIPDTGDTFTVNGTVKPMGAAVKRKGRQTYLPVRALCDALGFTMSWNATTRLITITDPASGDTARLSLGGTVRDKEELRRQVRDFLAWLQAQDVI